MAVTSSEILVAAPLFSLLAGAVITDLCRNKIPNILLFWGLVVALVVNFYNDGLAGVGLSFLGLTIGFLLFLPMYVVGGMGGGDVKLLAVVGAYLSVTVVWVAALSIICGMVWGCVYVVGKGEGGALARRYWLMLNTFVYIPAEDNDAVRQRFPFALAIFIGTLCVTIFKVINGV